MTIRTYLRRSKNDEGKQQFSLDVQRDGCQKFITQRFELADAKRVEYLDDGKAGDDFHSRIGMRRLLLEAEPGDLIVCRDQSRLGRDAIEVTLAIRDLVRDRGCRLFYYVNGQEVQFSNAIDQATTFIQGTGHQMELEAIRSRTREALRSRVREGRIAGGRCYGYDLVRNSDASGRKYTVAVVNEDQAEVIRRLFNEYLAGVGLKSLAKALNREGVPSPSVGRRGTGSWSPSAIRSMLHNPRYRGVHVHGRIVKVRRNGKVTRKKADPDKVISIDVPEWRIVEDDIWFAVQEKFAKRGTHPRGRPAAKYPLTGIAKCEHCGGAIGCAYATRRGKRVKAYACTWHNNRGNSVCPVTVLQPMDEVESALIDYLQKNILTTDVLEELLDKIKQEVESQMPGPGSSMLAETLEAQLRDARAEQRKLAKAVALADDIPELVSELHQRSARIRHMEAQLEAARRSPAEVAKIMAEVEAATRAKLEDLQANLAERSDLREVFSAVFPDGLRFAPAWVKGPTGRRRIWRVQGTARFAPHQIGLRPQRGTIQVGPGSSGITGTSGVEYAVLEGWLLFLHTHDLPQSFGAYFAA